MGDERNDKPEPSPTERAEELLDRAGRTAGFFVSSLGWRMARFASLAREEAEDILAEAQNVRREAKRKGDAGAPDPAESVSGGAASAESASAEAAFAEAVSGGAASGEAGATDAARRVAGELGVDLGKVEGTGADGRITVEDVRKEAGAGS